MISLQDGVCKSYVIKVNGRETIRVSYNEELGVYYQKLEKDKWVHETAICKNSFKSFCVLQNYNGEVYVFCQDICGDIILFKFEGEKWKIKSTIHMGHDIIMPVNMKAFFCNNDVHLLYNVVDEYNLSEILLDKVALNCRKWAEPNVVMKLNSKYQTSFHIIQDFNSNIFLISFDFNQRYRIVSKHFSANHNKWEDEEIVDESYFPYLDCDLVVKENVRHYIYITEEEKTNRVVHLYKNGDIKRSNTLFFDKDVNSCLIKFCDKVLWTLWICGNKLYVSFSVDNGISFSDPKAYMNYNDTFLENIFYKEYFETDKKISVPCKSYIKNINDKSILFLNKFLKKLTFNINSEVAIEDKFDITKVSLDKLYNSIKYQKEEINNVKYQLRREVTNNRELIKKCEELRDEVDYLRNKLKVENIKKLELEKQLDNLNNQDAESKRQLSDKLAEDNNDKKTKNSFKKWFWGS